MTGLIKLFGKGRSRFVHPDEARRRLDEIAVQPDANAGHNMPGASISRLKVFVVLEDINCYGSDGGVFEHHDKLLIANDVERYAGRFYEKNGVKTNVLKHVSFTPYQAIMHFELVGGGMFLPSDACQAVSLVKLFHKGVRKNPDGSFEVIEPNAEKLLRQYADYGAGYGYHNTNTIVDGITGRIIHYPHDSDFPDHGGTDDINKERTRVVKQFPVGMDRATSSLEEALKDNQKLAYYQDLTGLPDPTEIIDIARYLGKTAWSYPAVSDRVSSAWLGCNGGGDGRFYIGAGNDLDDSGAARGVRSEPKAS